MEGVLRWEPRLKTAVWAGERLRERFDAEGIGEAYLFSAEGKEHFLKSQGIPLDGSDLPLVKYIDAKEALSVQVHPKGAKGKNELWLIDEVYDHAAVYIGFCRDVSPWEVMEHCEKGSLLSLMRRYAVKKGDIFYIPGGTVHGACGISFFEVQNDLDVTYRLFDHGRGRPLRREAALNELVFSGDRVSLRLSSPEFKGLFPFSLSLCDLSADFFDVPSSPRIFTALSGNSNFCGEDLRCCDCFFVSAGREIRGCGPFLRIGF